MKLYSAGYFLFLVVACLNLFFSIGCVEPYTGTDNQIVVIGNGSDWSRSVVVDVTRADRLESLVLNDDRLQPVNQRLQTEVIKKKIESNKILLSKNEVVIKTPPLFLEWVAPTDQNSFILKADHLTQDAYLKEQQLYESGADGTRRREDLEDLPFSSVLHPIFLSDSSVIFVDQNDQLYWRDSKRQIHWLASNISDFISDGKRTIFYRLSNAWFALNILNLIEENSIKSSRQIFKQGLLYSTTEGSIFAMNLENDEKNEFHLKPHSLYEWSSQTHSLNPAWKTEVTSRLSGLSEAQTTVGQSDFFAIAFAEGNAMKSLQRVVLDISRKGIEVIPTHTDLEGRSLAAGKDLLLVLDKSGAEIEGIEICRRSTFWICDSVKTLPASLSRVVVTNIDEIIGLGPNSLYRFDGEKNSFQVISGTERKDLVGLRFLQVPSVPKIRNPLPPSR